IKPRSLLREREIHCNRGHDLYRFAIKQGGLVAPLLHSIDSGLGPQRVAADPSQVVDGSVFADHSFQQNDSLNAGLFGQRRIHRLDLGNQTGLRDVSTDAKTLRRRRWRWWWRRRR